MARLDRRKTGARLGLPSPRPARISCLSTSALRSSPGALRPRTVRTSGPTQGQGRARKDIGPGACGDRQAGAKSSSKAPPSRGSAAPPFSPKKSGGSCILHHARGSPFQNKHPGVEPNRSLNAGVSVPRRLGQSLQPPDAPADSAPLAHAPRRPLRPRPAAHPRSAPSRTGSAPGRCQDRCAP